MLARDRIDNALRVFDEEGIGGPAPERDPNEPPPPSSLEEYGLSSSAPSEAEPIAPAGSSRFAPTAIDDVTLPVGPPSLIEGILPARGLACIVGPPKSRKSFLATDMLFHVAVGGRPYAGRDVLPGPVFYLTGEGVNGFKRRLIAMRQHYGVEGNGTPFFMVENVPDLGSERTDLGDLIAELERFMAAAKVGPPRAIALDTLARCMGEGDENAAKDMGRFVRRCGELERRFGCLIVVIHHAGKDPSRGGRGSNALNGAADVTLTVEKSEAFSTVRIEESKDDAEGQEWRFTLRPVDLTETSEPPSETSQQVSTCVVEILSEPALAKPQTKPAKAPRGVGGDLLKIIHLAITEAGEIGVANAAPSGTRAVSRSTLKNYCSTMDWQDPDGKPDAFRSMMSKTLSQLRADGFIGYDKNWVWTP